jgi:hypothetical protein
LQTRPARVSTTLCTHAGDLGGKTLQQLVDAHVKDGEKPRLYWVDYWVFADIWDDMPPGTRVQHAGRCLYYLQP